MPKMVEYLKADKGTDEEEKAKSELEGALKSFDAALADKVPSVSTLHWEAASHCERLTPSERNEVRLIS